MILRTDLCGWIVLDKPMGMSSNHANSIVKHLLGAKTGHAGTLDPLATGVLPIAVGSATRLIPYLVQSAKTYLATLQWGEKRDTDDSTGLVTHTSLKTPTQEEIAHVLPSFLGNIIQYPPQFSALKIRGKRACDRIRRGEDVALAPRTVHINALTLVSHKENVRQTTLRVTCGKGTYIRSLARDLGYALQTFAHIIALRRERVGLFSETHAIPLEKFRAMGHSAESCVVQPESALDDILVTLSVQNCLQKGQILENYAEQGTHLVRLVCASTGSLLGLAGAKDGQWRCVWKS
ncbi:MAG: tRNA pseudouridine(55) synthase TruB [Holosporales bacterium]|jgi:tRNA pseudouridine55 synthase|nr:tRNA pseudouridine(55) synthase TruB [Holosporales bacterium]